MTGFTKKKWKFATIGLAAVLAVILTTPQAAAHVTTSLPHNVQHILDAIANMQSDIDSLSGNTATGTDIETLQDSVDDLEDKIDALSKKTLETKIAGAWHLATTAHGVGLLICNSDRDYKLYIYSQDDLDQDFDFIDVGPPFQRIRGDESYQVIVPADAGQEIRIDKANENDIGMNVYVVMETYEDATNSGCAQ